MATETQIGKLVIDLQIKTQALEKGLETAKKKLEEIEQSNKNVENSNKSLDASYVALSAAAVLAFGKIVSAIKDCISEYNNYKQAMSGLQNIADYTGQDMTKLTEIMERFTKYGLTQTDLATAIKNFSLMGYTAEETEQMIEALTNSAISNRQACYSVSEAVRVASEGYKNGISTLSDAAGVTENLSVMETKYAESLGKTASQLTEAEKNQAYLNRTIEAAAPFASATAEYMDTLAGKQGQYSQAMRDTQVAYAEALEPTLTKLIELGTNVLSFINSLIESNPTLVSGMTTFAVTLTTVTVAMIALKKAKEAYTTSAFAATAATKGFTAALMANPIFLIATTIATVVSAIGMLCTAINENEEAQRKLNETTEKYKQIKDDAYGYTDENISSVESDVDAIKEQIALMEEKIKIQNQINEINERSKDTTGTSPTGYWYSEEDLNKINELKEALKESNKSINEARERTNDYGHSLDELNEKLNESTEYLSEADAVKKISEGLDTETIRNQQKEAAQLKINANQMQKYLDIIKQGNKSSEAYQTALTELAKAYPEAANAEGIIIDQAQNLINAEQLKADTAWNSSQTTIQSYINILNAALQSESVQRQVAQNIGISYEELVPKLQGVLALLQTMAGYQPTDVPNVTPVAISTPKVSSSKSSSVYENKALDNYKKQIEHKKALDQISLKQEISMYETALNKYAKTSDEKMELREKIYDLNKELANKEKDMLDQQTEDYETYIQEQINNRGAEYDIQERTRDYDSIIQMHKRYLDQIMTDERLSLDERKDLYREELQTIRDYEQQKRDLRVDAIDNTVSQLTDAITKQLEEMQEKDKEMIDKNLEEVENWKNARIDAINEEYDARIEAIDKELEALNKAEEQKTRDEEDSEYEQKRKRLEDLIAFEHDATNKANYQKQLDELIADYQKTLDERALQDKKDALEEEKNKLQEEQDTKIDAIEEEADKRKEAYEEQLDALEEYYDKQIDMAEQTAEQMLLNVEQNQDNIINLLKNYGDAYEITGQSLGEKLAQGFNEGLTNNIQNVIQRVQDMIDAGIENKINEWTNSNYKYDATANKPQVSTKTINVYQTNNIEQTPEMPSETYRKLKNIDEQLASKIAETM